jgi:hypothetical protein
MNMVRYAWIYNLNMGSVYILYILLPSYWAHIPEQCINLQGRGKLKSYWKVILNLIRIISSETNRCNNVKSIFLSWITSTCFGHCYAHHQDTNISRLFYDSMRSCLIVRPVVVRSCAMGLVHCVKVVARVNCMYTSPLPRTCYMTRSSHSSRFDHPNDIGWGVQIIKLLVRRRRPRPTRSLKP